MKPEWRIALGVQCQLPWEKVLLFLLNVAVFRLCCPRCGLCKGEVGGDQAHFVTRFGVPTKSMPT